MQLSYNVIIATSQGPRQISVDCSSAAITPSGDLVFHDAGAMQLCLARGSWLRAMLVGPQKFTWSNVSTQCE